LSNPPIDILHTTLLQALEGMPATEAEKKENTELTELLTTPSCGLLDVNVSDDDAGKFRLWRTTASS
jgi:hypothetical protein